MLPRIMIPALLTKISISPNSFTTWFTVARMSSAEALSALIASALPPAASISLTSRFALSSELKYVNATAAPSEASRLTIPSPIPREPPVTRATLPANDRPYFSFMSILQSGPNLCYWIILSRIRFRFLSVRRVQFDSLKINNDKRASVRLHPASPASWNTGAPECPGGREGKGLEAMSDVLLPGKQVARLDRSGTGRNPVSGSGCRCRGGRYCSREIGDRERTE